MIKFFLFSTLFINSCSFSVPNLKTTNTKLNLAIQKSLSDSLFIWYSKECDIPMNSDFQVKNRNLFSFMSLYWSHNSDFEKYLFNYLDFKISYTSNLNYLKELDSIRSINFSKVLIDSNDIIRYSNNSNHYIYYDIINDSIINLSFESLSCDMQGIEFIYIVNSDTLIEFGKWHFNY